MVAPALRRGTSSFIPRSLCSIFTSRPVERKEAGTGEGGVGVPVPEATRAGTASKGEGGRKRDLPRTAQFVPDRNDGIDRAVIALGIIICSDKARRVPVE